MKIKLTVLTLLIVGLLAAMSGNALATVTISFDQPNSIASSNVEIATTGIPAAVFTLANDSTATVTVNALALNVANGLTAGNYEIWWDKDKNGVVSYGDVKVKAAAALPAAPGGEFKATLASNISIANSGNTKVILVLDTTGAANTETVKMTFGATTTNNTSSPAGVFFKNDTVSSPLQANGNIATITAVTDPVQTLTMAAAGTAVAAAAGVPNSANSVALVNAKLTAGAGAAQVLTTIGLQASAASVLSGALDEAAAIDSIRVYIDLGTVGTLDAADIRVPMTDNLLTAIPQALALQSGIFVPASGNVTILIVASLSGACPTADIVGIKTDIANSIVSSGDAAAGADEDAAGATVVAMTISTATTETQDLTGPPYNRPNGYLDAVKVTFMVGATATAVDDATISAAVTGNDIVVAGHALGAFSSTYNGDVANNTMVYIKIDEIAADITSSTPNFSYTAGVGRRILSADGEYGLADYAAAATTDKAAPAPRSAKTIDSNGNGKIDRIDIQFSEALNADTAAGFTISGYTVTAGTRAAGAEAAPFNAANMLLQLTVTEKTSYDTGAKPDYTFNKALSTLSDGAPGNVVESFNQTNIPMRDAAAPTVVSAKTLDQDNDGQFDALQINFSEPVSLITGKTADDITGDVDGFNFNGVFDVSYDFTGTGNTGAGTAQFVLPVNEIGSYDTAVQPVIEYNNAANILVDSAATPNPLAAQVPFTNVATAALMNSANKVYMQDGIAPKITGATTLDGSAKTGTTQNGKLDTYHLIFSEPMGTTADTYNTLGVAGHTVSAAVIEGANVYVKYNETGYDTGATPDVTYSGDTIVDANGAKLQAIEAGTVIELDGAVPVIYSATTSDLGWGASSTAKNGKIDGMTLLFSEPMDTTGVLYDGANSLKNEFAFAAVYSVNDTVKVMDSQTLRVYISEIPGAGVYDTNTVPDLRYAAAGTYKLKDMNGLLLADIATAGALVEKDGAAPATVAALTVDGNEDGYLDGVQLTFSENVAIAAADTAAVLSNINMARRSGGTNQINLTAATITAPAANILKFVGTSNMQKWDTGYVPKAILKSGTGIKDAAGNKVANGDSIVTADGASPVLVKGVGQVGSTNIKITFSEPVTNDAGAPIDQSDVMYYTTLTPAITISSVNNGGDSDSTTFTAVTNTTLTTDRVMVDMVRTVAAAIEDLSPAHNVAPVDTIAIVDAVAPTLTSSQTLDLNNDGLIDTIKLTFSEAIKDANLFGYAENDTLVATLYDAVHKHDIDNIWTVEGYQVYGVNLTCSSAAASAAETKLRVFGLKVTKDPAIPNVGDVKGDAILYLAVKALVEPEYGDTGVRPKISMVAGAVADGGSGVGDFSPNYAASISGVTPTDGAAPQLVSAAMVKQAKMELFVTEPFQSTLPAASAVFRWLVGTEKLNYGGYIANFMQDGTNPNKYIIEIGGTVVPAGSASVISFNAAAVIKDRNNVNNILVAGDTLSVTPPVADHPDTIIVDVEQPNVPEVFALSKNFPNPFNPTTTINYDIAGNGGNVSLVIYNMTGQKVRTLVDEVKAPGFYSVVWDGTNDMGETVASGIYLYKIVSGSFNKIEKMTFVK